MIRQPFRLAIPQPTLEISDHIAEYKHLVSSQLYESAASTSPLAHNWEELCQHVGLDEENQ